MELRKTDKRYSLYRTESPSECVVDYDPEAPPGYELHFNWCELTPEEVRELIPHLDRFARTGSLAPEPVRQDNSLVARLKRGLIPPPRDDQGEIMGN